MSEETQYEYEVTIVTDYLTITTGTALWLDDQQGNLSSEARETAVNQAIKAIKDELGIRNLDYNQTIVKLMLDDGSEEIL